VTLTLDDRIYMPTTANLPLRKHEEGHRRGQTSASFIADAEAAARALARADFAKGLEPRRRDEGRRAERQLPNLAP
jgi:hypothetical protein